MLQPLARDRQARGYWRGSGNCAAHRCEPGTTHDAYLHTGGAAQRNTQGLPRVQELFEARTPKGEAPIVEASGRLEIEDLERSRQLIIKRDDGDEDVKYLVAKRAKLLVPENSHVQVGQQLIEGSVDPKKVLRISGRRVSAPPCGRVKEVYRSQGVEIHDKHIEVIVRQISRRVTVLDSGTTTPPWRARRCYWLRLNRTAMAKVASPPPAVPS